MKKFLKIHIILVVLFIVAFSQNQKMVIYEEYWPRKIIATSEIDSIKFNPDSIDNMIIGNVMVRFMRWYTYQESQEQESGSTIKLNHLQYFFLDDDGWFEYTLRDSFRIEAAAKDSIGDFPKNGTLGMYYNDTLKTYIRYVDSATVIKYIPNFFR